MANTCNRDHSGSLPTSFGRLPESQGGVGRHKCAACAYDLGRAEGAAAEQRLRERVRKLEAEARSLTGR